MLALLWSVGAPAVSEVGTRASNSTTSTVSTLDISLTVPSGTELLVCGFFARGNSDFTDADWNTSESMTELANADIDGANSGEIDGAAFALVDPTAATDNVTVNLAGVVTLIVGACYMYDDVDNGSVADATDDDTAVSSQTNDGVDVVIPNFGEAGNALLIFGYKCGADSDPASIDDGSYTEHFDFDIGTGNNCSGGGFWSGSQDSAAGADGGTITFSGGNDPRGGFQVEINDEGGSVAPLVEYHRRMMTQ